MKMVITEVFNQIKPKCVLCVMLFLYSCKSVVYEIKYYPSGKKYEYGKIIKTGREGLWLRWYETGEKLGESNYRNNKLNGESKQWFRDGQIKSSAKYKDDKLVDTLKSFFSNGKPNYIEYFTNDGQRQGKFTIWYENGNISQIGDYVSGKQDGEWKTYFESGKLESISYYILGKETGIWTTYDQDGKILKQELKN